MLTGLVASGAPLPYTAVAAVPLAWAGAESVLALSAISASARSGPDTAKAPRRMTVSAVVSLVLVCILTVMVLLPYAVYPAAKSQQDCLQGANTAIATADCDSRFDGDLRSVLSGLLSSG